MLLLLLLVAASSLPFLLRGMVLFRWNGCHVTASCCSLLIVVMRSINRMSTKKIGSRISKIVDHLRRLCIRKFFHSNRRSCLCQCAIARLSFKLFFVVFKACFLVCCCCLSCRWCCWRAGGGGGCVVVFVNVTVFFCFFLFIYACPYNDNKNIFSSFDTVRLKCKINKNKKEMEKWWGKCLKMQFKEIRKKQEEKILIIKSLPGTYITN